MSYAAFQDRAAVHASENERSEFIRQTYAHLGGAVLACTALCFVLVQTIGESMARFAFGGALNWLLMLGGFMFVGHIANKWAQSGGSTNRQYLGLGLYVVAEAFLLTPLLYVAAYLLDDAAVIPTAGVLTLTVFGGLTASVFITKKDFSFMGRALMLFGFGAMGLIVVSLIFGFSLGALFSAAMVVLAGGYILYYTSNVLHHYPVGAHVAASLALFSALALLFWYILQLVMSFSRD